MAHDSSSILVDTDWYPSIGSEIDVI
jgi:hypothetical protein